MLFDKETATLGSALNICFWTNEAYRQPVLAARRKLNSEVCPVLYCRAQEIVFEKVPMVPPAHTKALIACSANVESIHFERNGDILSHDATMK
ncbi:MAG TPA: hypothetical protein VL171_16170 [Verrucomicrobiae bacterium]|nr:hypothetical protein [Verrucomicrobiae bacterium]